MRCKVFIRLSMSCSTFARSYSNRARSMWGHLVAVVSLGNAIRASNVDGPGGSRDSTRFEGFRFVEPCTGAFYAPSSGAQKLVFSLVLSQMS